MSIKGKACIAGAFEHPTGHAPDKSVTMLHAECALSALQDAGLSKDDVDGHFCAGGAPGLGPVGMVDYLNLRVRNVDSTDTGGSSCLVHVAHAAEAIAAGKCNVALITWAGRPRSEGMATGTAPRPGNTLQPDPSVGAALCPRDRESLFDQCMTHGTSEGIGNHQIGGEGKPAFNRMGRMKDSWGHNASRGQLDRS